MLVAGVEEQLRLVGRRDQLPGGVEIAVLLGEERVGVHAVHLHGDAVRPPLAELRDREAGVEQQRATGVRAGLRELLGGHDSQGEPAVDHAR